MAASRSVRAITAIVMFLAAIMLGGCASHEAYRTQVVNPWLDSQQCRTDRDGKTAPECAGRTPEIVDGKYELHFVEFDDQGWLHPQTAASPDAAPDQSAMQIDALMDNLKQYLVQPRRCVRSTRSAARAANPRDRFPR